MLHLSTAVEIAAPSLAEVAANLRLRSGQIEPAFSTHKIVEVAFPDALVTGRRLPLGVLEAVARTADGPVILYARGLSPAAQRFAIAHALAHLLFDGDDAFRQPGQPANRAVEERADAFAAELLVPLAELAPYVGRWPSDSTLDQDLYLDMVDQIASHFVVRSEVVDRQIRQLERLVRNPM